MKGSLINIYTHLWQTSKRSHNVHALTLQSDTFKPLKPTNLSLVSPQCLKWFSFDSGMKMKDKWNRVLVLGWALYLSLFSSNALEVNSSKVIFSTTSSLHLFLADGGYILSPWQNIKRWFSECVHGVLVTRWVYLPVCFMCVQLAVN